MIIPLREEYESQAASEDILIAPFEGYDDDYFLFPALTPKAFQALYEAVV